MDKAIPQVQQLPLQAVPDDVTTSIADLRFAGRYVPAGPGAEPVAGDFYDLLRLGPDRVALVVGDVAGHGTLASARMQQLRAAARAYAIQEPGPASVLRRLDLFCSRLDPESIATLWYGEYEPSTGTLVSASAGHPPPALTRGGEPARLLDLAAAPPLGAGSSGQAGVEHQQVLPPGAVLVAYSDGLVERRDADLDARLEHLSRAVTAACAGERPGTAADIAERILRSLVPEPDLAEDDVCLLVVCRET